MAAPRTDMAIVLGLISASSTFLFPISAVLAQITPDATLGSEGSVVTPNAVVNGAQADLIEGGALRGGNVFHSFQDFNVNDGQRVYFANPTGIENILSRVTGGNVSNIFGTLGVDGAANLFLLNPSGVVFGPNAQLDVSGAFTVTTAERYSFLDGAEFSATNPGQAPLVTVSITPGVQFNDTPRGDITNQGNLAVGAGETLSLYGDTVVSSGDLTAEGGTVQVLGNQVALTDQATVDVSSATGGGDVYIGGDYQGQGDLPTAQQTVVEAGVQINADALETGDGGTVIVWADDTTEFAGRISARGGSLSGNGGLVETSGARTLTVLPTAQVTTDASNGQWGTWLLDPADLEVVGTGTATIVGGTNDPVAATGITAATIVTALNTTAVTLLATNSITVNQAIDASGNANANLLTLDAPTLNLNQNIATEGGQTYNGNVVVGTAALSLSSDAGAIAFNGNIDGAAAATQGLTVTGNTVILGNANTDTVGATNTLASLAITGATTLNSGSITTSGAQTYNSAVTLGATILVTGSTVNFADTLALAGNNLTVTAGEADFGGNVSGAGTLTIQPNAVGGNITVGGAGGTAALDLTAAEIGRFQNTLTAINIGRADGTGTITLSGLADNAFAVATAIAGGATLVGPNDATTWNITGANAGNLNNDFANGGLTFQDIEAITGGTGDDAFNLSGGTISGAVNGGTGANTLTGNTGANTFTVTGPNSGTATGVGSFSNIQNLVGNTGTDTFNLNGGSITTLSGAGGADTFNLTSGSATTVNGDGGNDQFNLGAATVTTVDGGVGTDTVTGSSSGETFQITGGTGASVGGTTLQNIDTLEGGDGNDIFAFNDGVTFTGTIRGGDAITDTGTDTLNYNAFTTDPNVNLAALGATGIESVQGSTQAGVTSTLTGANIANTWAINGAGSGTVNATTSFSNFTNLVGGTNTDAFTIAATGSVTSLSGGDGVDTFNLNGGTVTTINGGAGADQFNLNSGTAATVNGDGAVDTFTLNGATVTTLNGGGGNDSFDFNSGTATNVNGDGGNDTFNLGATAVAAINGGAETDTINGTAGNDRFQVSGSETGTVTQTNGTATTTTFQDIEGLNGGLGDDDFAFNDGVTTTAIAIDGGGNTDTLDFSAYTVDPNVDLSVVGTNIETVTGTTTPAVTTLIGFAAANTWNITGVNSGTATDGTTTLSFSNFNTLTGNANGDTFNLNGGSITALNGAGGTDTFNLTSGSATTVNGDGGNDQFNLGTATVTTVDGGTGTDTVTGGNGNDTFQITAGTGANIGGTTLQAVDVLEGGDGNDIFAFNDGVTFTGTIRGGDAITDTGTDTLNYNAFTTDPNVNLAALGATGIESVQGSTQAGVTSTLTGTNIANTWAVNGAGSGTVNATTSFSNFTNLVGGTNTDAFTIAATGSVTSLSGGDGVDTFNLNGGTVTTINGGAGTDQFNLNSGTATAVNGDGAVDTFTLNGAIVTTLNGGGGGDIFTLTSGTVSGGVNGNDGGDTFNLGATAVAAIDGGAGADTINGTTGNDRFQVSGSETGTVTQTNGSATTTTFQEIENLAGALGDDTFAFNDTVDTSAIAIDGGGPGDTDTLDFSAYSTDPAVNLAIVGNSIENVIGTATPAITTLTGFTNANTWNITGVNSGTASDGGTTLSFSNFNTLTGNTNGDTFNLNGGTVATLNGAGGGDSFNLNSGTVTTVNGNAGQDTFTLNGATVTTLVGGEGAIDNDTLQGTLGNDSVTLSGNEAGTVNGTIGFSEIENFAGNGGDTTLVGTAGDDTLTLQSLGIGVVLQGVTFDAITNFDGSDGNDTIVGSTGNDGFQIAGPNTGQITQVNGAVLATALGFQNVENLDGGNGNDTFAFNDGVSSTAVGIDGGGAIDTLDFSAYTSNFSVDLAVVGTGIEVVNGSPIVTTATLLGFNGPTTWTVNGLNSGTVASGATTLTFNDFNILTGNTAVDTFNLNGGGSVTTLNGGDGNDQFNFNGGNAIIANGGLGDDTFTLNGVAVATSLIGGAGGDRFQLNNGATSTGFLSGGDDADTLDYSGYNADVAVNLALGTATGTSGASSVEAYLGDAGQTNTFTGTNAANAWSLTGVNTGDIGGISFENFQNLVGGTGNDTITWNGGSIAGGTINGGSGVLVLQSDTVIAFTGANAGVADITGTEGLVLQPETAGTAIRFGGAGTGLNVNPALLNEISASFTDITIGNGDTGAVALGNNPLTFQSPTTIQGASVTAGGGGNITANGQDISLNAFGGDINVQAITTSSTTGNGGNVRLTADVGDIAVGVIDTSSTTNLGGSVAITAAQGGVALNGDITTSGDQGGGQIEVAALNDVVATGITIGAETQGSGVVAQITSLQAQVAQFTAIRGIFEFFCSAFGFGCSTVNFYTALISGLESQITALQNGTLIPGSIDIGSTAGDLTLTDATLRTSSQGTGDIDGGTIALAAGQDLTLSNTRISSSTGSTLGDGGAVTLQAGGALGILANSTVETSTTGAATGRGGNITASSGGVTTISDSIVSASSLSNTPTVAGDITFTSGGLTLNAGEIIAETSDNSPTGSGFVTVSGTIGLNVAGGNIRLTGAGTSVLQMSNDSLISARAIQTGAVGPGELFNSNPLVSGGNIFISGFGTVQATGAGAAGNDIVTNANVTNTGGVIDISPSVLVGFDINTNGDAYDVLRTNGLNDIASNGTVAVFNLTIGNESSDNTIAFINAADLVGNSCAPASATSSFTVGGRGGTPVNPLAPLSPLVGDDSWIFLEEATPAESFYNAETTVAATLPAEPGQCYFQWRQAAL